MKFIFHGINMISDIVILVMLGTAIYFAFTCGNIFVFIITIFVVKMGYDTWKEQGIFFAWKKSNRQAFNKNWDRMKGK